MNKLKKGDTVEITKGKDRGKKGKILKIFLHANKALIEGLNLMKKHKRRTREDQKGGIVQIEAPVNLSNLAYVCKHCNRPTRIGFKALKDQEKTRICKSCKEVI